jgi:DNA-binding beta-propeller fold protein YncE
MPIAGDLHLPLILKGQPEEPPEPPEPTPTVPVPNRDSHVADLVVDPQSHYVYVASPRDDEVHFIHVSHVNTYTHEYYNDIVVGDGPTGLGVFPIGGLNSRIFVAHPYDWEKGLQYFYPNPADLIDPDNGYVGSAPFKVAVNPGLSRAYVSNYWDYLAVADTARTARIGWVGQKNYQGSWGIDVSADTNRVYLATRDTGELVAFDGNGDRLLQFGYIPTHFKPPEPCSLYTVAVNENTDHIFVPCPQLNKVFVHEEAQLEIFAQQELGTLELREDGWVRLLAPGDVHWLKSIPLDSGIVSDFVGVWGITVDEATNRIYLTDPENDALIVIQDAPARSDMSVAYVTKSEGAFDEPQGVDVDSERGRVFVGNSGNDTVSVLEATAPFDLVTTVDLSGP